MQTCFIINLRLEGGISSPVRYPYLSYCNISSLILSSVIMILCEGLSDARITSVNKKKCGFAVHYFKVNIWSMIKCNFTEVLVCLGFS